MDDLLERPRIESAPPAPADLLQHLRDEVDTLRSEVGRLRRENLELRQQVGYWKSRHADAGQRLEDAHHTIAQLGERQMEMYPRARSASKETRHSLACAAGS